MKFQIFIFASLAILVTVMGAQSLNLTPAPSKVIESRVVKR